MKKIEDYLHLYLGSDCLVIGGDAFWRNKIGYFFAIRKYKNHKGDFQLSFEDGKANYFWANEVKPILRPLSSMTEEEAIEVARLSEWEPHFRDVKVERNKYNDLIVTWQGSNESREMVNATGDCFYCAEQFQWLLSKGFDLFGLIDAGLAISSSPSPITDIKE